MSPHHVAVLTAWALLISLLNVTSAEDSGLSDLLKDLMEDSMRLDPAGAPLNRAPVSEETVRAPAVGDHVRGPAADGDHVRAPAPDSDMISEDKEWIPADHQCELIIS